MALPDNHNYADSILDAAQKPEIKEVNGVSLLLLPSGFQQHSLEKYLPHPVRKTGTIVLDDADSFVTLIKAHSKKESATLYCAADYEKGEFKMTAVLNDHEKDKPAWRDHIVVYAPKQTKEWKTWFGANARKMGQLDFAQFIENNLTDIASVVLAEAEEGKEASMTPSGSLMLEMALNLEANHEMKFRSGQRLSDGGINFTFINQADDATAKQMSVFERFSLGMAPFFNGDPYRMDARLRYRINTDQGTVQFWYELIKPEKVLEDAAKGEVDKISEQLEGYTVLYGSPGIRQS